MDRSRRLQVERFLEESAQRSPGKIALVSGDRRTTYQQIDQDANRLARGLIGAGVRRGDRVAIFLENSVEAVVAVFAALKAGAVFMVVNPTTKSSKLAFILNNSRAAALITDGRRLPLARELAARTPHIRTTIVAGPGWLAEPGMDPSKPANRCIDVDLAALIYTSGSTGTPKGVMLTHLNIVSAATSITTYLENTPDDIILNALPLSFDYGLYQVLMAFKIGGTVVLERSFAYPHAVLETVVAERVTGLPIVPTMSAILLQMDLAQYDLSRLRYITNTAAALPTRHIVELRQRLPHVNIYSMYGLTECKRVSYLPPDELDARPSSVGRAMPNEEVYIVDDAGERLPSGVGELVIRGSNVMKGYWELPEETAQRLKPGPLPGEQVLYSGDLFRMDEGGYLYFLGRKDDIIKTRGEKVSPREVENVLYELPAVAEAAVVGVEDAVLGQAIKAVVTLKDGATLTERDVLGHCAARLENFMVPKLVEFRASLPKTMTGKIDKKTLYSAISSGATSEAASDAGSNAAASAVVR
jgi:amino acid adenylation domain-containing protein